MGGEEEDAAGSEGELVGEQRALNKNSQKANNLCGLQPTALRPTIVLISNEKNPA